MNRNAEMMLSIAGTVIRLRQAAHLTQAELASVAGVTVETVARLERCVRDRSSANQNPTLSTLIQLSDALGIKLSQLLDGESSTTKDRAKRDHLAWRHAEATRLEAEARRLRSGA